MATFTVTVQAHSRTFLGQDFERALIVDKFCGNRRQIVENQCAYRKGLAQSLFAFPGLYQNWLRIDGFGGFQVTETIADEP
jgi:hypothetical protein